MNNFTIEVLQGAEPGTRVMKLSGPFVLQTVFEFQDLVRKDVTPMTVIDLTDVPYMDSAALGAVLGFHASCQREGTGYAITGASDRLRTLFKVAGVDGLLHFAAPGVGAA